MLANTKKFFLNFWIMYNFVCIIIKLDSFVIEVPLLKRFVSIRFISIVICYQTIFVPKWWQRLPSRSFTRSCCRHVMMHVVSIKRTIWNSGIWGIATHSWRSAPPTVTMPEPLSSCRFIPTIDAFIAEICMKHLNFTKKVMANNCSKTVKMINHHFKNKDNSYYILSTSTANWHDMFC